MSAATTPTRDLTRRAQQILTAADHLLAMRGADNVSMREVAERAEVNKALIFYYFGSRAQLFDTVLERYRDRHDEALNQALAFEGDAYERVHFALDTYMRFLEDNQLFARLAQQELSRKVNQLTPIRQCLARLHSLLAEVFKGALPESGPLSAHQMFITITSAMLGYYSYADAMTDLFDTEPMATESLDERRAHVHWLADTVIDRLAGKP